MADMVSVLPVFGHVRMEDVLVSFSKARAGGPFGTYAKTYPLVGLTADKPFTPAAPFYFRGRPVLYLVYYVWPRFQDTTLREKIETIVHELYHISPAFDGTLRVFPGTKSFHGRSREAYDERLVPYVDRYLELRENDSRLLFLRLSSAELARQYGRIKGLWIRLPRMEAAD